MILSGGRNRKNGIAMAAAALLLGLLPATVPTSAPALGADDSVSCARVPMPASLTGGCDGAGYHLAALSGDRQTGDAGSLLAEPIVARLVDEAGNGIAGGRVTFAVRRGCGQLVDATGTESQRLVLRTDARGDAAAKLRLGSCGDARLEVICAYAAGAPRPVRFIVSTAASSAAGFTNHAGGIDSGSITEEE